ncbi:alpha-hydroxy acid oxidase [Sphingomonas sp. IC081]|uniref:alpha-hydroxy acid oxidase n=1 Tax=Sphingomonas sp. IC081 TaxID=304378 RepID=UPI0021AFAF68|nr:alpha-hydroxy acid oxidase [Sphingomonas sp. IC081]
MRSLADYERRARDHFAPDAWEHVQSGADAGLTLADNHAQFDALRFVPRMLRDLTGGTTALELLGHRHAAPILLAPVAYHRLAHPAGELASIQAATALDTTMVVSTLASITLEEIAQAARGAAHELARDLSPLWFQLYFQPDRAHSLELVRRAEAAGYQVLMVTVDAAIKRSEFALPAGVSAANLAAFPRTIQRAQAAGGQIVFGTPLADAAPTWDDIAWLRGQTQLPVVIKGLLSPEDAREAVLLGMDGIVVSNHGGRVLDGLITPMAALPAMAAAVEGKVPLLLDGGVRRGTDVLKALALGASAVLIGRPQLHALAVAGMPGVAHMLHMLRAELELAMAQAGCRELSQIGAGLLA